jgi:hypothetical protein
MYNISMVAVLIAGPLLAVKILGVLGLLGAVVAGVVRWVR